MENPKADKPKDGFNFSYACQHIVFLLVAFLLGMSDILGKDLTLKAQSPILGYILVGCVAFLITWDIGQWAKHSKKNKEVSK
jgi:cobalamin biosynthesis protein CbiD